MGIFILIIVLGATTNQSGVAVIQQEFGSFDKCEDARKFLVADLNASWFARVRSNGCFKK